MTARSLLKNQMTYFIFCLPIIFTSCDLDQNPGIDAVSVDPSVTDKKDNKGNKDDDKSDETSDINGKFAVFITSESDLPICDENNKGKLFYIENEGSFRVCVFSAEKNLHVYEPIDLRGLAGEKGDDGADGYSSYIEMNDLLEGDENCPAGGIKIISYLDNNPQNGSFDEGEEYGEPSYACLSSEQNENQSESPPSGNEPETDNSGLASGILKATLTVAAPSQDGNYSPSRLEAFWITDMNDQHIVTLSANPGVRPQHLRQWQTANGKRQTANGKRWQARWFFWSYNSKL